MLTRIIFGLLLFSTILFAQSSTIHGNLIRIPFDAAQINPADTMGSWIDYSDANGYSHSYYINIIHIQQDTLFEKYEEWDLTSFGLTTSLSLENLAADTSASCGWWPGYYDVWEPYIIYNTIPFRVENGFWLMNGVYNLSFISNDGDITIIPWENKFSYISGKINNKYLTVFKKDPAIQAYDLYLLDLSNSPSFDTTNVEKVYFDYPAAPYEIYQISDSLYIAGVVSLTDGRYGIDIIKFENDTFHTVKELFTPMIPGWHYRNGVLYSYEYPDLVRYDYNPSDTSFVNRTIILPGGGKVNRDFTFAVQQSGDSLFIYDLSLGQLINTLDISSLNNPYGILIDSPYVYMHQTTYVTDVREEPNKLLSYKLQVYPNPFNPVANIVFTLPERGLIEIKMYDVLGREVKEIISGEAEAGTHTRVVDGSSLSSGVYFIRFTAKNYADTKKVLLLK